MLKFYFNKRIIGGLVLALSILFGLAYLSFENKARLIANSDSVAHTLDVLYKSEKILTIATNLELGQRGYTITGNDTFLLTFNAAKNSLSENLQGLEDVTKDNLSQQARIETLHRTLRSLLVFSERAVMARTRSADSAQALNASLAGKIMLDSVRSVMENIQREENDLLALRATKNQLAITTFNRTFIYLLVATTLVLMSIFYAINANLRLRIATEQKLSSALHEIEDLYNNAPCGYHSLNQDGLMVNVNNTLSQWLGYRKEELIGKMLFRNLVAEDSQDIFVNEFTKFKKSGAVYNLEFNLIRKNGQNFPISLSAVAITDAEGNYSRSRTITIDNTDRKKAEIEIKNLNRELEAFTYSVSHDLRAPLRSIDGYARILQEDYPEKLDAEGGRVINVIMSNAKRMGKLIDDLLDFARLGRKDLLRTKVDMTHLVNSVKKELLDEEKGRPVSIEVEALDSAPVDADMIKQVWLNLLSNAIKYSSKMTEARIKVSSRKSDRSVVYEVSDNGVGFDMQYVSKLFGVFQRLHRIQDFSGTGVGLAIVKRIIDKHDGEVWAEAKMNEGATFYFTIPIDNG